MSDDKLTSEEWADLFDGFWKAYPPRKGIRSGKAVARDKAWPKVKPKTMNTFNQIIRSVEYLKTTDDWKKENGAYIPMAQTFLNQERWDIEFTDDMEKHIADTTEGNQEQAPEPTMKPNKQDNKTLRQLYLEHIGYEEGVL